MIKLTRLDKEEFESLKENIKEKFKTLTISSDSISLNEYLFIILYWLKNYPIDQEMEFIFERNIKVLKKGINKILISIYEVNKKLIKWPSEQEFDDYLEKFERYYDDEIKDVVCVVDCTEIKIPRPADQEIQKIYYSAKKKQHSISFLVIVTLDGEFIYISKHMKGYYNS